MRVTAVVVHWQDLEDTRGCVASLEPGSDVVVVDNASREPVGEAFAGALYVCAPSLGLHPIAS